MPRLQSRARKASGTRPFKSLSLSVLMYAPKQNLSYLQQCQYYRSQHIICHGYILPNPQKLSSHENPKQIKAWKAARTVRLSYGEQQKKISLFQSRSLSKIPHETKAQKLWVVTTTSGPFILLASYYIFLFLWPVREFSQPNSQESCMSCHTALCNTEHSMWIGRDTPWATRWISGSSPSIFASLLKLREMCSSPLYHH